MDRRWIARSVGCVRLGLGSRRERSEQTRVDEQAGVVADRVDRGEHITEVGIAREQTIDARGRGRGEVVGTALAGDDEDAHRAVGALQLLGDRGQRRPRGRRRAARRRWHLGSGDAEGRARRRPRARTACPAACRWLWRAALRALGDVQRWQRRSIRRFSYSQARWKAHISTNPSGCQGPAATVYRRVVVPPSKPDATY